MSMPSQDDVLQILNRFRLPGASQGLVEAGALGGLFAEEETGGLHVKFVLDVDPAQAEAMETLRQEACQAIEALEGVAKVTGILSAHKAAPSQAKPQPKQAPMEKKLPQGVRQVIAVASGKGGVGKSTTAVNLALAFAQKGLKVGLLDADVYGPSVPRLVGLEAPEVQGAGGRLLPLDAYGLKVMSIGFLVDAEAPMLWRGPMVHGALNQLLYDVVWGDLDLLILDMPPGTGDAALSVAQQVPLTGAVIVSTPQDLALLDVRKGIAMFKRVEVPVLGMIENMSDFECPHCHKTIDLFGRGGAERDAKERDVPFLGRIPLDLALIRSSEEGRPIVLDQNSEIAKEYRKIVDNLNLNGQ